VFPSHFHYYFHQRISPASGIKPVGGLFSDLITEGPVFKGSPENFSAIAPKLLMPGGNMEILALVFD
jgi:hypothetical protein